MATKSNDPSTPATSAPSSETPVETPVETPAQVLPTALITNTLMVAPLVPGAEGQGAPDCDTLLAFVSEGHAHLALNLMSQQVYLLDPAHESATATGLTTTMLDHIIGQVARAASGTRTRICVAEVDHGDGVYRYAPAVAAFILAALSGLPFDHVWTTYLHAAFGADNVALRLFTPAQRAVIDTALATRATFSPRGSAPSPEPTTDPTAEPAA